MSDLISRQAVMDATKTVMKDTLDSLPTRLVDGEEIYDVKVSELDLILGINKALKNAIKSLPSETHEIRTETHGVCSDAISRQAAIRAFAEYEKRTTPSWSGAYKETLEEWIDELTETLSDVPTIGGWTPCSEKLPEDDGYYLVSLGGGDIEVEWYDKTGWGYFDVIAWMPLPKAWKEE